MPRNWSKDAPEGNGPVLQQEELGLTNPRWRMYIDLFKERFKRQLKRVKPHVDKMNEFADEMRATK